MSYFQVISNKYEDNPIDLGCIGVGFRFGIQIDGNKFDTFFVRVIFSQQLLNEMGKQFIGGQVFLKTSERSQYYRYAFHILKQQMIESNMENRNDIIIFQQKYADTGIVLSKSCEYNRPHEGKRFCFADKNSPRDTSAQLCESCTFPEPVCRCDDLRIESIKRIADASGDYKFQPGYYCINGKNIPTVVKGCESLPCFTPFKFKIA